MEARRYKNTGETFSPLGFGCMRFPLLSENAKEIDVEATRALIDRAINAGINYFDTAHGYHDGASQPVIGEILSHYPRERFMLATKMPPWSVESEADVHRIFEEQLRMCRVSYFDNYLIHNITEKQIDTIDRHRIYEILKEKQREGTIRRLGFSFHDRPEILDAYSARHEFDFAQIQLNYLDWELQDANRQYEILTGRGIPVIAMEPVRGGALADLPEDAAQILRRANPDVSVASWALRFAASLPNVLTVLSGMSNMEQLEDNIATMTGFKPLTEAEYAAIAESLQAYRRAGTIPCTACNYCMDCPAGVDIPKVFAIYNEYKKSGSDFLFQFNYQVLGEARQAHHCTACGHCALRCPQAIKIPEEMGRLTALASELLAAQ